MQCTASTPQHSSSTCDKQLRKSDPIEHSYLRIKWSETMFNVQARDENDEKRSNVQSPRVELQVQTLRWHGMNMLAAKTLRLTVTLVSEQVWRELQCKVKLQTLRVAVTSGSEKAWCELQSEACWPLIDKDTPSFVAALVLLARFPVKFVARSSFLFFGYKNLLQTSRIQIPITSPELVLMECTPEETWRQKKHKMIARSKYSESKCGFLNFYF